MRDDARTNGWEAFLFGGVPRTFWISGPSAWVRDFDLVFEDGAFVEMAKFYSSSIVRRNRFGGIKLNINKIEIDAWPLGKTWAFREGLVDEPSFVNLPKTTFLNIDSIVVEFAPPPGKSRRLFESGFFRCLRNETLDICLKSNPYPELCAVRSIRLARALGFDFSPQLGQYVLAAIESVSSSAFSRIQQSHYGRIVLDEQDLSGVADRLRENSVVGSRLFPKVGRQAELWDCDNFHHFTAFHSPAVRR